MATSVLSYHLRRSRPSLLLPFLAQLINHSRYPLPRHPSLPLFDTCTSHFRTRLNSRVFLGNFHSRAFSTFFPDDGQLGDNPGSDLQVDSELLNGIEQLTAVGTSGEDTIFPVRALISVLDGFHDFTGFPWWMIIASSTLTLRIVLLSLLILQLRQLKRIGEFLPTLPPPFPPPQSGRSLKDQFSLFQKERKAVGCPSLLWHLPYITVQSTSKVEVNRCANFIWSWLRVLMGWGFSSQPAHCCMLGLVEEKASAKLNQPQPAHMLVPCFFFWMVSIRMMSLNDHPGFNCGGALWFQDLTELPHGWSGFIFPLLIAGLHYTNVKISFQNSVLANTGGILALLADFYKWYLKFLTLPIAFIGFAIPQIPSVYMSFSFQLLGLRGSLLYWITNSSLTIIQQLTLSHPTVLAKLGLPHNNSKKEDSEKSGAPKMIHLDSTVLQDKSSPMSASEETSASKTASLVSSEKWFKIPAENSSPRELTAISVHIESNGDRESAILLLRLALDKDPEYVRALVLMGHLLLQKKLNAEAIEYFERAISKLSFAGHPTEVEDVDLLILASQWAGVACERQGKWVEGLVHFERVASLEEPEDPACKAHYFNGLLLLASTLYDAGQKDEAAKYLRLVVAYNPAHTKFLELCERDNDIASDLAMSRREF
ncbi:ALBINO3-like protein 2, chloroplastic [Senna tora]|uniref:ALBINO3-like protein 2, chloroplastic n=1 Tax=Senna tora TaxID=362788 RepID=A0A834T8P7_9FABA|nr:ALBINO3-like protein 2, chloroplastic [Senna tora]